MSVADCIVVEVDMSDAVLVEMVAFEYVAEEVDKVVGVHL